MNSDTALLDFLDQLMRVEHNAPTGMDVTMKVCIGSHEGRGPTYRAALEDIRQKTALMVVTHVLERL